MFLLGGSLPREIAERLFYLQRAPRQRHSLPREAPMYFLPLLVSRKEL